MNIPTYEMQLAKFIRDFHPEHPTLEQIDLMWYRGDRQDLYGPAIEAARKSKRKDNPLTTKVNVYTTYDRRDLL